MKSLLPVLIIILLLIVIKNGISGTLNSINNKNSKESLENTLNQEQTKNQYLKEKLFHVKTNKFVEEEARDKLGMLKNGEFFVIAPTSTPLDQRRIVVDDRPNWEKWWELFF